MTALPEFSTSSAASDRIETTAISNGANSLRVLGAELAFVQDAAGIFHAFYWQDAHRYGLQTAQLLGTAMQQTFFPVDMEFYCHQVRMVLESRQPTRFNCQWISGERRFLFELAISPVLAGNERVRTVLVMGRRLPLVLEETSKSTDCQASTSFPLSGEVQLSERLENRLEFCNTLLPHFSPSQHLLHVARHIRHTLELEAIWQQMVNGLGSAFHLSSCLLCPYTPESKRLQVAAEYTQKGLASCLNWNLNLEEYPEIQQALARLEPVVLVRREHPIWDDCQVLVVATFEQRQPNGVILLCPGDRLQIWQQAEIAAVQELADQVGTAIAHAQLYRELETARQEAEEVSRLKSNFLANTSHELRTPLNGILGFLKLILDGMADDPQEQLEFVQEAYRSGEHLLNIINDILDIAKIESGKMELDLESVNLNELMIHLSNFVQSQFQQKSLYFQIKLPPTDDEIVLYGNYQRLLQVLLNLVGNALKFTHEGGITITAEVVSDPLVVKGRKCPGSIKVQVADTGIGVSLDKQSKLFQKFIQIDGSRTRQYGGTGLGLVISQKLVESMGGVVNFYSMGEGLGATVTFTVPLYQEPLMISTDPIDAIDLLLE
jgi:signal transduction histidine kinase